MPATFEFFTRQSLARPGALVVTVASAWLAIYWLQEVILSPVTPIAAVAFRLPAVDASVPIDFAAIEKHLAAIHTDDTQNMEVTAEFDRHLNMVAAAVSRHTGTFPTAVKGLIEQSFPGANGNKLAMLAECFYYYKQAEAGLVDENTAIGLADLAALQTAYFGEVLSYGLFSDYYDVLKQMLESAPQEKAPATPEPLVNRMPLPTIHEQACTPLEAAFTH